MTQDPCSSGAKSISSSDFKYNCRDDYLAQAKNEPSEFWDFANFTSNCSRGRLASDSAAVLIFLCWELTSFFFQVIDVMPFELLQIHSTSLLDQGFGD